MIRDVFPGTRLVISPKVLLPLVVLGLAKFAWLITFSASARNCSPVRSVTRKSLSSEASTLISPGPSPKVRGASPNVYWAGEINAAVLNHSAIAECARLGLATRFGRTPSEYEAVLLVSSIGLSGVPVWSSAITPVDQPPTIWSIAPDIGAHSLPRPTGNS